MVALEVFVDEAPRRFDDRALAKHEVADRDVVLDPQIDAIQAALPQAAEIQRGLPQRLRGNRPRIDGRAARLRRALDDADLLTEVRGLRCAFFARRTGADDDEVEVIAHAGARRVRASSWYWIHPVSSSTTSSTSVPNGTVRFGIS